MLRWRISSKGWVQAWPLGIETLNASTINNEPQKEHGLGDPLHVQPYTYIFFVVVAVSLKSQQQWNYSMKEAGDGRKKNIQSRDSHEFSQNHVPFSAGHSDCLSQTLFVGRCDHAREQKSCVLLPGLVHKNFWDLFLSLADGEMERVLPRAWRRDEPQGGNSLGPWLTAWKEVCKARNTCTDFDVSRK